MSAPGPIGPGSKLGHYVVVRAIASGGMGEVFEAHDTRLDRSVALKVVKRDVALDPNRRRRLEREARAAAGLNHPHIVTLHSIEEYEDVLFLTMELVVGTTLQEAIPPHGLAVDRVLRTAMQLADALAAAHAAGIIHRDLKPANVMCTRSGTVKVLDFGLSKSAADGVSTTTEALSVDGVLVGTVPYMAPEVIEGAEADHRSDIFALGIVLFEMATGRRPFDGPTPLTTMTAILRDAPPLASDINPRLPVELAHLIDRCLEKSPASRRQSASDLRADLEALHARVSMPGRSEVPPPSARDSELNIAATPARFSRGRIAAVAVAAAALIGLGAALLLNRDVRAPGGTPAAIRSLAILPLDDLSGDPSQAHFREGMTEELITKVARLPALRVTPRSSVMRFTSADASPRDIARALGVDAILEGTVLRTGTRVRISVHLVDPAADSELWAESYERDFQDVLALQSEVALAIANRLQVALTPADQARVGRSDRPVSPAAYDAYLKGLTYIDRVSRSDTEAAVTHLERAAALDPSAPDVWGVLAVAYAQLTSYLPGETARLERQALAAIEKAGALDPESADAQYARGFLVWDGAHGWPHEESATAYRRALARKPNLSAARRSLAVVLNHVGLAESALGELSQAEDTPAVLMQRGLALRIQGDVDRALAAWLAISPAARNANHIGHIAWGLADTGRTDEALCATRQGRGGRRGGRQRHARRITCPALRASG